MHGTLDLCSQAVYHGFGVTVPPGKVTAKSVQTALRRVLTEPSFMVGDYSLAGVLCNTIGTESPLFHASHSLVHLVASAVWMSAHMQCVCT